MAFAGDGMTCWFPGDGGSRAVLTALAMVQMEGTDTPIGLGLKCGVAMGEGFRTQVGDPLVNCFEILAGEPAVEAEAAEKFAECGQVILRRADAESVGGDLEFEPLDQATDYVRALRVTSSEKDSDPSGLSESIWANDADIFRPWIPASLFESLTHGEKNLRAELRLCVPLFVRVVLDEPFSPEDSVRHLDACVRFIQSKLSAEGGAIVDVNVARGGLVVYGNFGALVGFENNVERAARAATLICDTDEWRGSQAKFSAGLSSGRVRVGPTGSGSRWTFAVMGSVVSVAARLMQHAAPGQVLASATLAGEWGATIEASEIAPLALKGLAEPLSVVVLRRATVSDLSVPIAHHLIVSPPVRGREGEIAELSEKIQSALSENGSSIGKFVLLKGPAGIGKSLIFHALRGIIDAPSHLISGTPTLAAVPLAAPKRLFWHLLGLGNLSGAAFVDAPARAKARLEEELPAKKEFAPLLAAVVPGEFQESRLTVDMDIAVRADNTRELLGLLLKIKTHGPTVLWVENGHFIDAATEKWLAHILREDARLVVVMTSRDDHPILAEFGETLELCGLPDESAREVLHDALGGAQIPDQIGDLLIERAKGHPLYLVQLVSVLLDRGHLRVVDGKCKSDVSAGDLARLDVPDSLEAAVLARFDRLKTPVKALLKAGSVLGLEFYEPELKALSFEASFNTGPEALTQLYEGGFLLRVVSESRTGFRFAHAVVREVVYASLDSLTQATLHRKTAEFLEGQGHGDDRERLGVLALHYVAAARHESQIEIRPRAIEYCDRAALLARGVGDYPQAVRLLQSAQDLTSDGVPQIEQAKRAFDLADTFRLWGRFVDGRAALELALEKCGETSAKRPVVLRFLVEVLRQFWHRKAGVLGTAKDPLAQEQLVLSGRAHNMLSELAYFSDEKLLSLLAAVRTLNLQERAGPTVYLGEAYSTLGLLSGIFSLHRVAQRYFELAFHVAQECGQRHNVADVARVNALYLMGTGSFDGAREKLTVAYQSHEEINDHRHLGDVIVMRGMSDYFQGRYQSSLEHMKDLGDRSRAGGIRLHRVWSDTWMALNALALGDVETARVFAADGLRRAEEEGEKQSKLGCEAILAELARRSNDLELAFNLASQVHLSFKKGGGLAKGLAELPACYLLAEVSLALLESQRNDQTQELCAAALKYTKSSTRLFPFGASAASYYQARYQLLAGSPKRADKLLAAAEIGASKHDLASLTAQISELRTVPENLLAQR